MTQSFICNANVNGESKYTKFIQRYIQIFLFIIAQQSKQNYFSRTCKILHIYQNCKLQSI